MGFRETHLTCPCKYFLCFAPNKNSVVSVTSFLSNVMHIEAIIGTTNCYNYEIKSQYPADTYKYVYKLVHKRRDILLSLKPYPIVSHSFGDVRSRKYVLQRTAHYASNDSDFIFDKVDFPKQYDNDKDFYHPTAVRKQVYFTCRYWSANIRFMLVAPGD